jgi:hypothetical protein
VTKGFGAVNRESLKHFRQLFEINQQATTTNLPKMKKAIPTNRFEQ